MRVRESRLGQERLADALLRLSAEERDCLLLRERLGLSVAEISAVRGCGSGRVRAALYSARERLRLSGCLSGMRKTRRLAFLPDEEDC